MAIGPFVFEFSTSYSVPRSCALSMQSHSGWRFSSRDISACEDAFSDGYRRKHMV
jgi:hypothetical protein